MEDEAPATNTATEWDELIGPFYDAVGVAEWLGVTLQTLERWTIADTILGVETTDGHVLYPRFQWGSAGEC